MRRIEQIIAIVPVTIANAVVVPVSGNRLADLNFCDTVCEEVLSVI